MAAAAVNARQAWESPDANAVDAGFGGLFRALRDRCLLRHLLIQGEFRRGPNPKVSTRLRQGPNRRAPAIGNRVHHITPRNWSKLRNYVVNSPSRHRLFALFYQVEIRYRQLL